MYREETSVIREYPRRHPEERVGIDSPCILGDLRVSAANSFFEQIHHRGARIAEVAQRKTFIPTDSERVPETVELAPHQHAD